MCPTALPDIAEVRIAVDAGDVAFVNACRRRGDDDDTLFFNLARRRLGRTVRAHRDDHAHIVVACMPKSASTYLCTLLARVTGFRSYLLNTLGHDTERDVLRPALPMFVARDTVSQEHMRATRTNVDLLRMLGVRPVVLVRDLLDQIISARDHQHREHGRGPAAHIPAEYVRWSDERQLWFNIHLATPWLLSFYASWCDAATDLDVLWLTYEQVTRHPHHSLTRVLGHCGIAVDAEQIARGIADTGRRGVRFNRGESGRGRKLLTERQIETVHDIAEPYRRDYDLSLIGL